VRLPADARERQELRLKTLFSAKAMHQLGERYEPLGESNLPEVLTTAWRSGSIPRRRNRIAMTSERFLARHGGATYDYAFLHSAAATRNCCWPCAAQTEALSIPWTSIRRNATPPPPPVDMPPAK